MFGIFASKSEKKVKKLYFLHRELFSSARNTLKRGTSFWLNYTVETGKHMEKIFLELSEEKGEEYSENLFKNLLQEQSLSLVEQEIILEKFMMSGNMHFFGQIFLVSKENERKFLDKWAEEIKPK